MGAATPAAKTMNIESGFMHSSIARRLPIAKSLFLKELSCD
jgi:hypothetical protein